MSGVVLVNQQVVLSGEMIIEKLKQAWTLLRNMVTSLIHHERIETTVPKAKELRRVAENMVQLAKRGDMHAKRQANAYVRDHIALHKLWSVIGPNYVDRNGGYTRI